jgi:hypothetical protein
MNRRSPKTAAPFVLVVAIVSPGCESGTNTGNPSCAAADTCTFLTNFTFDGAPFRASFAMSAQPHPPPGMRHSYVLRGMGGEVDLGDGGCTARSHMTLDFAWLDSDATLLGDGSVQVRPSPYDSFLGMTPLSTGTYDRIFELRGVILTISRDGSFTAIGSVVPNNPQLGLADGGAPELPFRVAGRTSVRCGDDQEEYVLRVASGPPGSVLCHVEPDGNWCSAKMGAP